MTQKTDPTRSHLYLDFALTLAFLAALKPFITGMAVHEWLGLAIGAALGIHALLHHKWIACTTRKLTARQGQLPLKVRLNYGLDATLLLAFITIIITGVAMSREVLPLFGLSRLALPALAPPALAPLHKLTSYLTLALLAVKLFLHRAWIACAVKRALAGNRVTRAANVPATVAQTESAPLITRRNFLILGGSAVCVLALTGRCQRDGSARDAIADVDVAACPFGERNDPYPGKCERYVDRNQNGICDRSEQATTATPAADATAAPQTVIAESISTAAPTLAPTAVAATPTPVAASQPVQGSRCPRGFINDPYPGHCRYYQDRNGNGYCDLSEVA